jgi:hypothetical protein
MEDLDEIRRREPALWEDFAVSVEQALPAADTSMPFVISTCHEVEYDGRTIRICGLLLLPENRTFGRVLAATVALTPELHDELVKTFGIRRAVRRKAVLHLEDGDLYSAAEALQQEQSEDAEDDDTGEWDDE